MKITRTSALNFNEDGEETPYWTEIPNNFHPSESHLSDIVIDLKRMNELSNRVRDLYSDQPTVQPEIIKQVKALYDRNGLTEAVTEQLSLAISNILHELKGM